MFFSSMIVCVPTVESLKEKIMTEAHHKRNIIHLGANKMYQNLKIRYWWSNIKREITGFVSRYLKCNQIKARCQKTPRLLCPLGFRNGKMARYHDGFYFRTSTGHVVIWVIIDLMTKSAHFLPMRTTSTMDMLAKMYGV